MEILAYWKIAVEIIILWYIIYLALLLTRGTRTEQLLKGIVILGTVFLLTQWLGLDAINWLITKIFPISVIAVLIIFQPELRRALAQLGQFGIHQENVEMIEEVAKAAANLSSRKTGGLIAIEREAGLKPYIETGVQIDSAVTKEMIVSIFMPLGPLHDGAVIIERGRIIAAGCLLPLSQEDRNLPRYLGTRHRAAIGLSEETDAVCIVVSEETGTISVALGGRLTSDLSEESLTKTLKNIFYKPAKRRWRIKRVRDVKGPRGAGD